MISLCSKSYIIQNKEGKQNNILQRNFEKKFIRPYDKIQKYVKQWYYYFTKEYGF